jgi:hypothetical protein
VADAVERGIKDVFPQCNVVKAGVADGGEGTVEAFYYYMGFLSIMGFTPLGIYELYFKKERLNEWRITTQY